MPLPEFDVQADARQGPEATAAEDPLYYIIVYCSILWEIIVCYYVIVYYGILCYIIKRSPYAIFCLL